MLSYRIFFIWFFLLSFAMTPSPSFSHGFIYLKNDHSLFDLFTVAWGVASFFGIGLLFLYNHRLKSKAKLLAKINRALDETLEENTRKIIDSSDRLRSVLNAVPSPVYYKDPAGVYLGCNDAFSEMILGLNEAEIIGRTIFDMAHVSPALAEAYHTKDLELIEHPGTQFYEAEVQCADEETREFFFSKATIKSPMGQVTGLVGVMVDITKRKRAETALRDSQERIRSFQDASFGAVLIHDGGKVIDCNKNLLNLSGYSRDDLVGSDGLKVISAEHRPKVLSQIQAGETRPYDAEMIKKDGTHLPIEIKARIMPYQGRLVRVAEIRDISERKKTEQEMEGLIAKLNDANEKLIQLSITDSLTTLYCRSRSESLLKEEMEKAQRRNKPLALIMADIDGFRHINETYGKAFGDKVLKKVSQAMLKCLREIDFVGRFGGDEFLLVLPETSQRMAGLVADRIRMTVQELSWNISGLFVTLSMGVSTYDIQRQNDPLKEADSLLTRARKKGGNQCLIMDEKPLPRKKVNTRRAPQNPQDPSPGSA